MHKRSNSWMILVLALVSAGAAIAERADDSGRKSKNGRAEGTIDGVSVVVEYGRPSANGRQIWGGLVPYGKVWRTGADEATTITFDKNVLVGGEPVAAGTYALFTLPGEDESAIILNSVAEQWGAFGYDASKDVAKVAAASEMADDVETFEITVEEGGVRLAWADRALSFAVTSAP